MKYFTSTYKEDATAKHLQQREGNLCLLPEENTQKWDLKMSFILLTGKLGSLYIKSAYSVSSVQNRFHIVPLM